MAAINATSLLTFFQLLKLRIRGFSPGHVGACERQGRAGVMPRGASLQLQGASPAPLRHATVPVPGPRSACAHTNVPASWLVLLVGEEAGVQCTQLTPVSHRIPRWTRRAWRPPAREQQHRSQPPQWQASGPGALQAAENKRGPRRNIGTLGEHCWWSVRPTHRRGNLGMTVAQIMNSLLPNSDLN